MSKHFRAWRLDQPLLLPPSVRDFVPKGHLADFVLDLVQESLDLTEILASYTGEKGQPPFHPRMMVAVLLYAYANGIYSSRRIAKAAVERADFMMLVALDPPDFRTIAEFRRRHLRALGGLFVQVLRLAATMGLVKLGHVAVDGTKIKANASKHKAMSYERMKTREAELAAEVAGWLAQAEAVDAAEDKTSGREQRGDELPPWVADKQKRLARLREAKAALEAEAQAAAEEKARAAAKAEDQRTAEGRKKPGRPAAPPSDEPNAKAQRNFTDPESRIMKSKDGFVQAYNAQAAVDSAYQIIVAQGLTQSASDQNQLVPLVDGVVENTGLKPAEVSADSGFCSEANLAAIEARAITAYVATGRAKDAPSAAAGQGTKGADQGSGTRVEAMRERLRAGGHEGPYRLRKQVVEPVFGQIKQARGFRQFLLRGVDKVRAEWAMICTAHNLLKLAGARPAA
jgi:transposase